MFYHISFMGKIYGWKVNFFTPDIMPYVKFSPVADRENPHIFSLLNFAVVDIPEFRPLSLRIPLAKFVPDREDSFLGPCLFFIPSGPSDTGVQLKFFNGVQERKCLKGIAAGKFAPGFGEPFLPDGVFHFANDQFFPDTCGQRVPEIQGFLEIVSRIDMKKGKWKFSRTKSLQRQMDKGDGILPSAKKQGRTLKLPCHLPHDMYGLGFQLIQIV